MSGRPDPGGGAVTWWVGEQFNPDGSATYAELTDSAPGQHPQPGPNQIIYGPYRSQAAARAAENRAGQLAAPHLYRGSNVHKGPAGLNVPGNQGPKVPNPLSGLAAIGDFFGRLGQANTWIRVAEVGLGIVLISIGIAKITNAVPIATKIAKTAGAGALL